MRQPGQQGFTLIELMTAVALTAVLGGAMVSLAHQARRGAASTDVRTGLLDGYRNALALAATDVREALDIERLDHGARITTPDGERRWSLEEGVLIRAVDGAHLVVARDVHAFEFEQDGRLWLLSLVFGRGTSITTAALPRTEVQG